MSKETVLKKEFQKKDVERLRNLMQGKYGEKTRSSVGFSQAEVFYSPGSIVCFPNITLVMKYLSLRKTYT